MNSAAWLLDCGSGLHLAVGDREMIELVRQQDCFPVPGAPDYCRQVLRWQQRSVPVMDIARLHGARPLADEAYVSVLNYLDASRGVLCPVGIRVARAPSRIVVDDSRVCAWPDALAGSRFRIQQDRRCRRGEIPHDVTL